MSKAEYEAQEIINPINGKVALKPYADSFMETVNANKSIPRQLYNNLILYPKGMSQNLSSSGRLSLSVGSIIIVPATGHDIVGA